MVLVALALVSAPARVAVPAAPDSTLIDGSLAFHLEQGRYCGADGERCSHVDVVIEASCWQQVDWYGRHLELADSAHAVISPNATPVGTWQP